MGGRIVVIGASLSGIDALRKLIGGLPADFPAPILICQHVAAHSPGLLPHILTDAGKLKAIHPRTLQVLEAGIIYVAPPDRHMLVEHGYVRLSHGPHENFARPAVDPLFRSAAIAYGPAVVGIVLTGQLDDGTAGLLAIKDRGGTTIVQEPSEAAAPSMPTSALRHVPIDHRCGLDEMAKLLTDLARDDPSRVEPEPGSEALIEAENRIAEGVFRVEDWWSFEHMSTPSGYNCPICRSAVYEVKDKRLLRFRCRSGHAFSALSLLSGQADARENLLSSVFGVLVDEVTLTKRLLSMPEYASEPHISGGLAARATELEIQSGQVSGWLHALTGLVEPEPG
jgi:two-component system, chemotaxis family, protein-glutamate methylesterase/glutaminase